MGDLLERLAQQCDNLLLAEVAALLHEMTKLNRNFILSQLKIPITDSGDGRKKSYATFINVPMDDKSITVSAKQRERFLKNKQGQTWVWNDLEEEQREHIRSFSINLCQEHLTLTEILTFWHWLDGKDFRSAIDYALNYEKNEVEYRDWLVGRHGYALWLLDVCHSKAQVDKALDQGSGIPQATNPLWIATAFGYEKEHFVADDLTIRLKQLYFPENTSAVSNVRSAILKNVEEEFPHALGDTQRPINEISLWDWSWSTAGLYKSALAKITLEFAPFDINKIIPTLLTTNGWRWCTLRVTVDVLGLLGRAHRIPDVLGYQAVIDTFFNDVKQIIEVEYPLGNEIYRDSTGIYFTFPDVNDAMRKALLGELDVAIRAKLDATVAEIAPAIEVGEVAWGELLGPLPKWLLAPYMLAEPHEASIMSIQGGEAATLLQPADLWRDDSGVEICPVCGLRSMYRKAGGYRRQRCKSCEARAQGNIQSWRDGKQHETIWLDEIADKNDRIALIVGRFHLEHWLDGSLIQTLYAGEDRDGVQQFKEPSPARILRIWRTTEEFWKERVSLEHQYPKEATHRRQIVINWNGTSPPVDQVLDGTIASYPLSLFHLEGDVYITILNNELCTSALANGSRLQVQAEDGRSFAGEIERIIDAPARLADYRPTRTILTSPDQFLALVPAADALEIAGNIAERYACEMGKVRSRLPLDLALVYFHRKMPLYAVIDAARRFLAEPAPEEKQWVVMSVTHGHKPHMTEIKFDNGIDWEVNTDFGDGTADNFYPYIGLWNTSAQGEYRANGRGYVHVKNLAGKEVAVAPSHFSYLWLDTSTRRYAIGKPDSAAPFVTQGMYLEEISKLQEMWKDLQAAQKDGRLTDTALHGVIQLLLTKRQAWGKGNDADLAITRLACDVLARQQLGKIVLGDSLWQTVQQHPDQVQMYSKAIIMQIERFFRCFDLHYRIMKQRLASAKDKQSQSDEKETAHI